MLLRSVDAPEVLYRGKGFTVWHGGVIDGPHGLALTVEVLDESGSGRMIEDDWQSSALRRWPLDVTMTSPQERLTRPQEIIEARSPHYYRLISTFGKFGRGLGPRLDAAGARLDIVVHPLELRLTRQLSGAQFVVTT